MADTNEDDSMGVAAEVSIPGASETKISDIENDIDFPTPSEVTVVWFSPSALPIEAHDAQLAGTPRSAATIAFDALAPGFAASTNEVPPLRRPSADTYAWDDASRTRFPWLGETLDTQFKWAASP